MIAAAFASIVLHFFLVLLGSAKPEGKYLLMTYGGLIVSDQLCARFCSALIFRKQHLITTP